MAGNILGNGVFFQLIVLISIFLETSSYEELLLESGQICRLEGGDGIKVLGKQERSSIIVTQNHYFTSWSGRFDFRCNFQVKAPKDYGIYAVIQGLNFRKNESSGKCKDYVSFARPVIRNIVDRVFPKREKSEQYCGRVYPNLVYSEWSSEEEEDGKLNSFISKTGEVEVSIYIARERLRENEKLDVKLVFTAFKDSCSDRSDEYFSCRNCQWIWGGFVKDGVQNCPGGCKDEGGCHTIDGPTDFRDVVSSGTGTKVTVGAVSTIIIMLGIFILCLWVCRKTQRLCWHVPNGARLELRSPAPREEEPTAHGQATPSAPPEPDIKDLPPSYDSLFPAK